MTKLSVENTMLKEKLKEQKKLVISLQKHKRKLEHQVEAFQTNEQQSSVLEKVHSKLDLIYGTVQRMSCSTANPLLSHTLSAIQFWCPIASNYPKKKKRRGGGGREYVQSTKSSSVSDGSSDSGTSSSDDMEASVKKQDKSAKKKKEHSIKKSSKQKNNQQLKLALISVLLLLFQCTCACSS